MEFTKAQRLQEVFRRLALLPRAANFEEARRQLEGTLNSVEDEMTSIPFDPDSWASDGRMYPVRDDNIRTVPGHPAVKRLRSRAHDSYIGVNGSMEIRLTHSSEVLCSKPGADGKGVWEQ